MHIIAIAWIYVVLMMAVIETSIVAGVLTLFFYGLLPLALVLWIARAPARRRRRQSLMTDERVSQDDGADAERDQ